MLLLMIDPFSALALWLMVIMQPLPLALLAAAVVAWIFWPSKGDDNAR